MKRSGQVACQPASEEQQSLIERRAGPRRQWAEAACAHRQRGGGVVGAQGPRPATAGGVEYVPQGRSWLLLRGKAGQSAQGSAPACPLRKIGPKKLVQAVKRRQRRGNRSLQLLGSSSRQVEVSERRRLARLEGLEGLEAAAGWSCGRFVPLRVPAGDLHVGRLVQESKETDKGFSMMCWARSDVI